MTAQELWNSITRVGSQARGNSMAILSERQRAFLIDLAKAEKIFDVNNTTILFPTGVRVRIREAFVRCAGYGGTIGKKSTGKFKAEEFYLIEFTDTKLTAIYRATDLEHFKQAGHPFRILKPTT